MSRSDRSLSLSLDTVVAASSMLGHALENRRGIQAEQDEELAEEIQQQSCVPLRSASQAGQFLVAPLDILVSRHNGRNRFHFIELNGSGIGGLTNASHAAVTTVLNTLETMAHDRLPENSVVLIASSGQECVDSPRRNRLLHEKLLYAESIKRGIASRGHSPEVFVVERLACESAWYENCSDAVVVGYIPEFLESLEILDDGRLTLFNRVVTGVINDRFCLNLLQRFGRRINMEQIIAINGCYVPGGDKGVAYRLMNEHLQQHPSSWLPPSIPYEHAVCREELIEKVLAWTRRGQRTVIKPHATGVGHGIEFFLDARERTHAIIQRIDRSIDETSRYYRMPGGAFPYTLCEFVDTRTIERPAHPWHGHKYELRIVVYHNGQHLFAYPSIVKVASDAPPVDPGCRLGLINNITASSVQEGRSGSDFMLPLCNQKTLDLLEISRDELAALCREATGFVRFTLDRLEDAPEKLTLPGVPLQTIGSRTRLRAA